MTDQPLKITVITVCYNCATTLANALQSVAGQSWPHIEHIVVDGASTDDTMSVIEHYRAGLEVVVSEPDTGIYDAMNKGVALATGDIVAFLNADDFYKDANVLARIASVMQVERLDALYGDVEFFWPGLQGSVVRRYNSGRFAVGRLGWGWMPAHPALFVRRELFERFGAFRADYRIAGDFEFIARVFRHPELQHRHLPESLVCMQLGGVSTSGWRATLEINREMMRACRENGIQTNWFKMLVRYPLKVMEYLHV